MNIVHNAGKRVSHVILEYRLISVICCKMFGIAIIFEPSKFIQVFEHLLCDKCCVGCCSPLKLNWHVFLPLWSLESKILMNLWLEQSCDTVKQLWPSKGMKFHACRFPSGILNHICLILRKT